MIALTLATLNIFHMPHEFHKLPRPWICIFLPHIESVTSKRVMNDTVKYMKQLSDTSSSHKTIVLNKRFK